MAVDSLREDHAASKHSRRAFLHAAPGPTGGYGAVCVADLSKQNVWLYVPQQTASPTWNAASYDRSLH